MIFKPQRKLQVIRNLSNGQALTMGILAQNTQSTFFQYDSGYLSLNLPISPFHLTQDAALQKAPRNPHLGLHGVFADALPDGWGLLLQDRVFRQHSILPALVTQLDRLAFVGDSAMGALSFAPVSEYNVKTQDEISLEALGLQAQAVFDGQTDEILAALVAAGSSGGARPKAQLYFPGGKNGICQSQPRSPSNFLTCRTQPQAHDQAWLVKFTSQNLTLGHEEGVCEAAYLMLADKAELNPPHWQLLNAPKKSGATYWLALKRFDRVNIADGTLGRIHMHSACGLLDADFRSPSLDYEDLIKASRILCQSPAMGRVQFQRGIFNLFACNQDDHSKNWSFLQDDQGRWTPAPFYDVTFSPHPFGEHACSFAGFGQSPSLKAMQRLASAAGYGHWRQAQQDIRRILDSIGCFADIAANLDINAQTIRLIQSRLDESYQANKVLL